MKIFKNPGEIKLDKGSVITIGTFDGVHLGHRKILTRLTKIAGDENLNSLVFTFHPHPRIVLFPDQTDLHLLTTTKERAMLIEQLGVEYLLEYPFTRDFAQIDPEFYVKEILCKQLNAKKIVIGYDHRFGHMRKGSIQLLRKMGPELGFEVEEIPAQDIDDINISSTRIRKALEDGNIKLANSFLGYPYFITGTVIEGKKLGRQLGYPTANIQVNDAMKLIPRQGIYAVTVTIDSAERKGMMCIGSNPTTDEDGKIKLEVNIFDFEKDIYGKEIRVHFKEFLRKEEKFSGLDELKQALHSDKTKSLELLK